MPGCILRVDGAEFDPDAFLATSGMVTDTIYRRGERRSTNSVNTSSGFTTLVCDENELEQQVRVAIEYLRTNSEALGRLRGLHGVTAVLLDVGCNFPIQRVVGMFYRLPTALLAACSDLGIEIELSVYATQ